MKKSKKVLAGILVVLMLISFAPLQGFIGIDFSFKAKAVEDEYLYYRVITEADYDYDDEPYYYCYIEICDKENPSAKALKLENIEHIEIPSKIDDIEVKIVVMKAFDDYTNTKSITIPDSVEWIKVDGCPTFSGEIIIDENNEYYSAENYSLFDKEKSVLEYVFAGFNETSYIVPDSVLSIYDNAFEQQKQITSLTLGENYLTNVLSGDILWDDDIFWYIYSLENLERIEVNENNTTLYAIDGMLYDTKYDTLLYVPKEFKSSKYIMPDSITGIHMKAFCSYPENITEIKFGKNFSRILDGNSVDLMRSLKNLTTFDVSEDNQKFSAVDGVLFDKDKEILLCYPNQKEGDKYTIPDCVCAFSYGAFDNPAYLTELTFGKSIGNAYEDIDGDLYDEFYYNGRLKNCSKIKNVFVSDENEKFSSIDGVLFNKDKTELIFYPPAKEAPEYTIPDGVTSMDSPFENNTALKKIIINDDLKEIGHSDFKCCYGLTEIIIPDTITAIGEGAFMECTSLSNVKIGSGVKLLDYGAFFKCESLKTITVPKNVTEIRIYALGCKDEYIFEGDNRNNYFFGHYHDFAIYGYKGTAAEEYATEKEFIFIDLEGDCVHTLSDWIITRESTPTEDGEKRIECTICHEVLKKARIIDDDYFWDKNDGDILLHYKENTFDRKVSFSAEKTENSSVVDSLFVNFGKFEIYDINITDENGEKVQPLKPVWVSVPLPKDFNGETAEVFRFEGGEMVYLESYIEDGYLYFKTDHFSIYALVDESSRHKDENNDGYCDDCGYETDPVLHCTCKCHRTGIVRFFWSIGNFFQKLFGKNKVCTCGVAH